MLIYRIISYSCPHGQIIMQPVKQSSPVLSWVCWPTVHTLTVVIAIKWLSLLLSMIMINSATVQKWTTAHHCCCCCFYCYCYNYYYKFAVVDVVGDGGVWKQTSILVFSIRNKFLLLFARCWIYSVSTSNFADILAHYPCCQFLLTPTPHPCSWL